MTRRDIWHTPDKQGLKRATSALVDAAGGQVRAATFATRIKRHQSFADYGLRNTPEFMPVDVVLDLEEVTRGAPGWPHVVSYLAARLGCTVVELPPVDSADDWFEPIGGIAGAAGALTEGMCGALAGSAGALPKPAAEALLPMVDGLIRRAATLRAMLEQVAEERG